ncbi:MAG: magnesium-translocating P-type ATPase [Usitatibacter sp.]
MSSAISDPDHQDQHLHAIELLAQELKLPYERVLEAYEDELGHIRDGTKVPEYLSLFALRAVREKLVAGRPAEEPAVVSNTRMGPKESSEKELLEIGRLTPDETLAHLDSSYDGLLDRDADERLEIFGLNAVAQETHKHPFRAFLDVFLTPLPLLLLVLAGLNYATGEVSGAVVIALIVFLSSTFAFVQEYRSSKAAERLKAMVGTTVTVLRKDKRLGVPDEVSKHFPVTLKVKGSEKREVPLTHVVPGDIIQLSAGDLIPADVRILQARDLFVNQASLTGESLPVEKFAAAVTKRVMNTALELENLAFMGTNVVSGTALAVVAMTGRRTYFGGIAADVTGQRQLTSFDKGVQRFIWLIIRFMLVMVPLVFVINGFTKGDWLEAFLFAVAVAVGLAPEMLPMIVTINLAKGALAMANKKVIVKRLNSIQNLGAMDVLCTDKTGTITQDHVILERHVDVYGNESEHVLEYAYLNSFYQSGLKNLLDKAVLEHVEIAGRVKNEDRFAKVDEIPFDFQRRRMSVVVAEKGGPHLLICKGAVEEVFSACSRAEQHGEIVALEEGHHDELMKLTQDYNEEGFRVIAVAYKEFPADRPCSVSDESDLILAGYIAFLDPPKESARAALQALKDYGITVKVLTGDNDAVARNVCRQVGLEVDEILTGSAVEALSDDELATKVETVAVLARLSPAQKARVIKSLHSRGHVVGFMGDGINDGPALKIADVGISVDTAVDIAKESADIILLEKNLLVLEQGVIEGRKVFGNIIKYIKMGASSNFGNMFSVLGASAFLPFLPMAPVQILVNNLLYDFSQTTVATDEVDDEYLRKPRQWDISNIGRFMLFIGPISSLFDYVTFGVLLYYFGAWGNEALFQTGWFVESLLSQTLIVHVIRTGRIPFIESRPSFPLLVTTLAICIFGVWLPTSPLAGALGMTQLPHAYWLALLGILGAYMLLTQLVKSWLIRKFGLS